MFVISGTLVIADEINEDGGEDSADEAKTVDEVRELAEESVDAGGNDKVDKDRRVELRLHE